MQSALYAIARPSIRSSHRWTSRKRSKCTSQFLIYSTFVPVVHIKYCREFFLLKVLLLVYKQRLTTDRRWPLLAVSTGRTRFSWLFCERSAFVVLSCLQGFTCSVRVVVNFLVRRRTLAVLITDELYSRPPSLILPTEHAPDSQTTTFTL